MAKPAAKRVKTEKGADSEPAPTEAPAAAPVKEEKKPARPKTAAEVAHEAEMKARSDPYKGRALFGRQLDISTKNGVLGGSGLGTYCTINADQYPRRGGQEIICCSYTYGAGLPTAAGLDGTAGFREDGGTRPLFVRRGGYPAELRNERYGPYNGTAPGAAAGKKTNGWEYCGDYRMERDDMVDGISLSSMPEVEQQHWLVARGVQIKTSRRRREVLAHRTTGRGPAVRTWSTTSRMTRSRSSSRATASSSSATTSSSTRTSRRTRTSASQRCKGKVGR